MDITISVSDHVVENIQERAKGKPIEDFVEEFVEETFAKNTTNEGAERPFMRMKGMFSSGRTDTSSRIQELLNAQDFDPKEGFSIR